MTVAALVAAAALAGCGVPRGEPRIPHGRREPIYCLVPEGCDLPDGTHVDAGTIVGWERRVR